MARVRYQGRHPELSVTLPVFPAEGAIQRGVPYKSAQNEVCAFPPGRWMPVSRWAAVWLAGARRRGGPWFDVRLERGDWAKCIRQASWLRKARDVVAAMGSLTSDGSRTLADSLYEGEMKHYEVVGPHGGVAVSSPWRERL